MTFSPEWDRFWSNVGKIEYDYSHALAYLLRLFCGDLKGQRVLELGTGQGNNIEWLTKLGADYWGIEGSEAAADIACARFPQYAEQIAVADFTQVQPFADPFDIIVDRAAVSHNDSAAIRRCINLAWDSLGPGGLYFGVDWFSINHSEFCRGEPASDHNTRTGYPDGQFKEVGKVHFADETELAIIFAKFEPVYLLERTNRSPAAGLFLKNTQRPRWNSAYFNGAEYRSALWDIVVRKPK